MSQHTPGPWTADDTATVRNADGWIVAEVLGGGAGVPEMHPNARLIAVAPDLLEALKRMSARYGTFHGGSGTVIEFDEPADSPVAQARAAIAKAAQDSTPLEEQ